MLVIPQGGMENIRLHISGTVAHPFYSRSTRRCSFRPHIGSPELEGANISTSSVLTVSNKRLTDIDRTASYRSRTNVSSVDQAIVGYCFVDSANLSRENTPVAVPSR